MSKTLILTLVSIFAFALPSLAGEKEDAMKIVDEAAAMLKNEGPEKTLAEIGSPKGKWTKGELYIFAYKSDGTVVAHPINPRLVGKNLVDQPDAAGKLYRKEIVESSKKAGSGWVDYLYKNPTSGKTESKSTFWKKEGDYILCAGVYKK